MQNKSLFSVNFSTGDAKHLLGLGLLSRDGPVQLCFRLCMGGEESGKGKNVVYVEI